MGEGRGALEVQKNIYSRKGKLNFKKINARQLTLKNFMPWRKKIHTRNVIAKKIPAARKFPNPPPHNFSNGLSLSEFFFKNQRVKY